MSSRLEKSWMVLASHQTDEANRCVDTFPRPDGTYGRHQGHSSLSFLTPDLRQQCNQRRKSFSPQFD
jgi:hypothetical protein